MNRRINNHSFVLLDDYSYVLENPFVRHGLTPQGIVHAFTGITVGNWHPVTMLSHMLDCQLFGTEEGAGWHHTVNLALHAANTVLLFIALRRMTGTLWRSALAAALFGLHPLHVETVAWVSERKDSCRFALGRAEIEREPLRGELGTHEAGQKLLQTLNAGDDVDNLFVAA